MKKIIVLLLLSQSIFAQRLSKEDLIEKISIETCDCSTKRGMTNENLEMTLGVCMIESVGNHEKDIEKHYGKNITSDKEKMGDLSKDVGRKMAVKCPAFLKVIMNELKENSETEDVEEEDEEETFITGNLVEVKSEQFISFTIKESSGKSNSFILLNNFDNSFLLTDNILKNNDLLDVYYYELELFDAKIKKFVTYKIVSDIIKK